MRKQSQRDDPFAMQKYIKLILGATAIEAHSKRLTTSFKYKCPCVLYYFRILPIGLLTYLFQIGVRFELR